MAAIVLRYRLKPDGYTIGMVDLGILPYQISMGFAVNAPCRASGDAYRSGEGYRGPSAESLKRSGA